MSGMSNVAAFFDVDHTILSKSSGTLYMKYLYRIGEVGVFDMLRAMVWAVEHKLNLLDAEKMAQKALEKYRDTPEKDMIRLCDTWFEAMVKDYIYPEAVEKIEHHRREGHRVTIATAATVYLARPLSKHLKIEDFICTYPEVKDGIFTGEIVKPMGYGEGKVIRTRKFCEEKGVDLSQSYFYSDSMSDIDLLRLVGHPVAVNPDPILRREAQKLNWPIVDFDSGKK